MIRETVDGFTQMLDTTRVAGRPLTWYLSGWRIGIFFLALALIFPWTLSDQTLVVDAISIGIYVMLALGLNIVVGYAGLLDLGYVAFFAIGSYVVAIGVGGVLLNSEGHVVYIPTFSFWLLLPIAALVAGIFGVLLGAPTLRLRGDYLAIVTLGFGEIVPLVFQVLPYFYGSIGMSATPPPDIGPISFSDPLNWLPFYYLTLTLVVVVILAVSSLRDSSLGRAWIAIREDETAAAASGVNLVRTKLLAFGLGAVTGGIGGALNAAYLKTINPVTDFQFQISITILIMIVLGGLGSIPGVILGAIALRFLDTFLIGYISNAAQTNPVIGHLLGNLDLNTAKFLIYGIILLVMILLRPQGLIPNTRRSRELAGIGASVEGASAVGLLAREESESEETAGDDQGSTSEASSFAGSGSDAQGREG